MTKARAASAYLYLTLFASFTTSLPAVPFDLPSVSSIQASKAPLPTTRANRGVPLSQYNSTIPVTGLLNASTLSLPTVDDFPIPYSDYSLRFGNMGSQLHPWDLETILIAISAAIEEQLAAHGRNAHLPSTEYSMDLAGLRFWIQRMPWDTVNLAWAQLAIIVDGLWLYIVDGGHDRESFIDVLNHGTGMQVALGWIGKPHMPLESTSSTGAARKGREARAYRQD